MDDNNKIIRSLWIGKEISFLEKLSMISFIRNGHLYYLYVYNDVKALPDGIVLKDANTIIPENKILTGPGTH